MAQCINSCSSGRLINLKLSTPIVDKSYAKVGEIVTISCDVIDTSWVIGGSVSIDVIDTSSSECVYGRFITFLSKGGTQNISFQITMPNRDVNLRISASSYILQTFPLQNYWACEDVKYVPIILSVPGAYYICDSLNKRCIVDTTGTSTMTQAQCISTCGGTSGCDPTTCPRDKNYCLLGQCIKKSDLLIVAGLGLAFMFLKSK